MTSEKLNCSTVYDLSSYGVPQLIKFGLSTRQRLAPQGNLSLLFPYTMFSIGTRFYVTHSKHGDQKVRTGNVKKIATLEGTTNEATEPSGLIEQVFAKFKVYLVQKV